MNALIWFLVYSEERIDILSVCQLTICFFASLLKNGLFGLLDHNGFKASIIDEWATSWWISILYLAKNMIKKKKNDYIYVHFIAK